MKDKTNALEVVESAVSDSPKVKSTPNVPTYNPDDYMEEEFIDGDMWYYSEKCFSCAHWLGNDCGAPTGSCSYE